MVAKNLRTAGRLIVTVRGRTTYARVVDTSPLESTLYLLDGPGAGQNVVVATADGQRGTVVGGTLDGVEVVVKS